jgi:hypothetical protein
MTSQPVQGRATRAVMERYQEQIAAHRRWTVAERAASVLLVLMVVLFLVVGALGTFGLRFPWFVTVSPIPLVVGWFMYRTELLRFLGRPGAPLFPEQMLQIAARTDAAEAAPQAFGATPPGMRTYNPDLR